MHMTSRRKQTFNVMLSSYIHLVVFNTKCFEYLLTVHVSTCNNLNAEVIVMDEIPKEDLSFKSIHGMLFVHTYFHA